MIVPEGARNIEFVGHTDQGGRGDGVQVMVARGHAYIGTRVQPRRHGHRRARPAQSEAGELRADRIRTPCACIFRQPTTCCCTSRKQISGRCCRQQEYYGGSGKVDSSRFGKRGEDYAAGMSVYDIKDPANPRKIGFLEVEGSACTASGIPAGAMPMPRRCSTGSPTTS